MRIVSLKSYVRCQAFHASGSPPLLTDMNTGSGMSEKRHCEGVASTYDFNETILIGHVSIGIDLIINVHVVEVDSDRFSTGVGASNGHSNQSGKGSFGYKFGTPLD